MSAITPSVILFFGFCFCLAPRARFVSHAYFIEQGLCEDGRRVSNYRDVCFCEDLDCVKLCQMKIQKKYSCRIKHDRISHKMWRHLSRHASVRWFSRIINSNYLLPAGQSDLRKWELHWKYFSWKLKNKNEAKQHSFKKIKVVSPQITSKSLWRHLPKQSTQYST